MIENTLQRNCFTDYIHQFNVWFSKNISDSNYSKWQQKFYRGLWISNSWSSAYIRKVVICQWKCWAKKHLLKDCAWVTQGGTCGQGLTNRSFSNRPPPILSTASTSTAALFLVQDGQGPVFFLELSLDHLGWRWSSGKRLPSKTMHFLGEQRGPGMDRAPETSSLFSSKPITRCDTLDYWCRCLFA